MLRVLVLLALVGCQSPSAATQFGDEGPVDCVEGDALTLDEDQVPQGFPDTPVALLAGLAGTYGDGSVELTLADTLAQALLTPGLLSEHAATDVVCPDRLSLVSLVEVASADLEIPSSELWITVDPDGGRTARLGTVVHVAPSDPNDDEGGSETVVASSDWAIAASLEPTTFVIEDMQVAEAVFTLSWSSAGAIEAALVWYGTDAEGSYEQTTASYTLVP